MNTKIPKKIHYVWVGGNEKPKKIQKCMETWKKKYPEYEIMEWNENNFDINSNKYVEAAYKAKKWAFVSDYIRMYAIYNYGGVYFDTDVIAIGKLDEYLQYDCFVGYESNDMPFTAVFGAVKYHPFIKAILDKYDEIDNRFDSSATNTILVSNMLIENYKCKLGNKRQVLKDNILVLPKEYLCNPSMRSRTIHAFDASWTDKKKRSKIYHFEISLRGKMTNKFKIFFYRIIDILVFTPKKFLAPKIKKILKK